MAETIEQILTTTGAKITAQLKDDILNKKVTLYGPVNASGNLHNSIRFEVDGTTLRVYAASYIYFLQYGRKPGKFPPKEAIRQWIIDKFKIAEPSNSLVFLIRRKIAEKGTTAYEQGGTDLLSSIFNTGLIGELQKQMVDNFILGVIESFTSEILHTV